MDFLPKPEAVPEPAVRRPDLNPVDVLPKPELPITISPRGPGGRPPPSTPKVSSLRLILQILINNSISIQPVYEGCALPVEPAEEDLKQSGQRFGSQPGSRLEFNTPRGKFRKNFDFSLDFRTSEANGIIFYVSDGKTHKHYAALLLQDGYVSI